MYQQKDLTSITRNIHVKYQSSSTQCLKVSSKVKVSNRITDELQNIRKTDCCKYRFLFYSKKKLSLSSKSFFRKYDKNNTFIFVQKYPKAVGGLERH